MTDKKKHNKDKSRTVGGWVDHSFWEYKISLRQAHEFPHKLEQPQVRYWYAKMLTDRDAPGDRDKARPFLGEAIEAYGGIDFSRHLEMLLFPQPMHALEVDAPTRSDEHFMDAFTAVAGIIRHQPTHLKLV